MLFARQTCGCFLVLIVCFLLFVGAVEKKCPSTTSIYPCTCNPNEDPAWVVCPNISDMSVLQDVFDRSDEPFWRLSLFESSLMYFPSKALVQKNVNRLYVMRSTLYTLFDRNPEENHKLVHLEWINSRLLRGLLWEQLTPLKALRSLMVETTLVPEIGKSFEQSVSPTLQVFMLFGTNTKKFSPTLFQKFVNLFFISVVRTRLSTLKRSMFPAENKIEVLDFRYNLIKSLPDDIFSNMPKLIDISLIGNQLKIFSEAVFGRILDLEEYEIDLTENPISCDCSFKWVLYKETPTRVIGQCGNPSSRKGKNFIELIREDFSYCPNSVPMLLETSI